MDSACALRGNTLNESIAESLMIPFKMVMLHVPSENRVRRDDRRDLTEPATAHTASPYGQPTALVIGEADPATLDRSFLNEGSESSRMRMRPSCDQADVAGARAFQ
jgi:hypothetical protein